MGYISRRFTVTGEHEDEETAVGLADMELTIKINALKKELGTNIELVSLCQTADDRRGHFPREASGPLTIVAIEYLTVWKF